MKVLTVIARILLGLIFVVFGSNAFLHFIPMPPIPQNLAGDFVKVFFASGYVYVIGALQLVGGLFLLVGLFVPLGLTIFAAIIFNILVFHTLMAPEGFPPALVVTALELFLLWQYRAAFTALPAGAAWRRVAFRGRAHSAGVEAVRPSRGRANALRPPAATSRAAAPGP